MFGANAAFRITPQTGKHVDSLIVDGRAVTPDTAYTFRAVQANHTIRAVFAINYYALDASAGAGGSIIPSGRISVPYGADTTFRIRPLAGSMSTV